MQHVPMLPERGVMETELFFLPLELLPDGTGFALYGREHSLYLASSALACLALCLGYRRLGAVGRERMRRVTGGAILLCELLKTGNIIAHGLYSVYHLPLHLCSMAVFFCFAHSLRPGGGALGDLLYSSCMPGALFALLFPDWTVYPPLSYHCIVAFTVHTLLAAYPLMQVVGGDLRPRVGNLPKCFLTLLLLAAGVYCVDRAFGANYMFLLSPAKGSPLAWFAQWLGSPGYILGYLPMILVVWTLLYLPFRPRSGKQAA